MNTLREALLKCREEFCWHGNTGKTLSADTYAALVDMVDAALDAPIEAVQPLEPGYEADLWRLYEELYGHRTDQRGPSVAVGGAIEVIRAWRTRGAPAERDAKRYRWLRKTRRLDVWDEDELDAAIYATCSRSEQPEEKG